jgi:hypothetical protein
MSIRPVSDPPPPAPDAAQASSSPGDPEPTTPVDDPAGGTDTSGGTDGGAGDEALDDAVDVVGALMAPLGYDQIEGLIADSIRASQPLADVADGRGVHLDVEPARSGPTIRVDDRVGRAGETGPGVVDGVAMS